MNFKKLPKKLISRLHKIYSSEDLEVIAEGFAAQRITCFRTNTLKSSNEEIISFLNTEKITFFQLPDFPLTFFCDKSFEYQLKGSDLFYNGKIYLQNFASQLPPLFLDLKDGMTVLDVTAAPGSKTSQISALLHNSGKIVACEKQKIRFDKLNYNLRLQGCTNVSCHKMLAQNLQQIYAPNSFDAILLDAPCSAEGRIFLDNERTYGFWNMRNIFKKAHLQKDLLETVLPLLAPGGVLVYSTCTLAPEENEVQIQRVLKYHRDLCLEPIVLNYDFARSGLDHFQDQIFCKEMTGCLRLLPSVNNEGFFVAKLKKK